MSTQPVAVRKQLASAECILVSAAAFMLEYGDGISKIPLIWVHTLMSLLLLFHMQHPDHPMKWTAIGPESCTNVNSSECILTRCTTHHLPSDI